MSEEEMTQEQYSEYLEDQVKALQTKNTELSSGLSSTRAVGQGDGNLINLQLDVTDLLKKLEQYYRGEYLHTKKNGDVIWKIPDDKALIPLNEFGVTLMMEAVTKYIDKNTTLSNYSEARIYEIIGDIGDELILVIYCNYERMGMDTASKKTKFRLIITTTLHLIESAYRRAIDGETFIKLNESTIVTQSHALGGRGISPQAVQQKKRSFFDPRTWGGR